MATHHSNTPSLHHSALVVDVTLGKCSKPLILLICYAVTLGKAVLGGAGGEAFIGIRQIQISKPISDEL